ncbi:hypothetical protein EHP00_2129 [Ecytonucleospora hepatopenaei]|uniref:Secreted protein n=1 Tax=Ecytonucleospora hepatopenaei TaxID=646526 RepID=A0A1W0E551_9MICR|nr:hypothetical protein EHP00_2129 [Ecytonucleospora hepatopenaei]
MLSKSSFTLQNLLLNIFCLSMQPSLCLFTCSGSFLSLRICARCTLSLLFMIRHVTTPWTQQVVSLVSLTHAWRSFTHMKGQ